MGRKCGPSIRIGKNAVPKADIETIRREKLNTMRRQPGEGPKDQLPGAGYNPGQVVAMPCALCGQRMMITPRQHPYYVRRFDGTIAWLCAGCGGSSYRLAGDGKYLHEK